MKCTTKTSPKAAVDFFTPLFLDTNITYAVEEDKFPGLQDSRHFWEPALLVLEDVRKQENICAAVNGSTLSSVDNLFDMDQTADCSLYDLIESVDFDEIAVESPHPCRLLVDTCLFDDVRLPCLQPEKKDTDLIGKDLLYPEIERSLEIPHTTESWPKSGTKRKRCVLENSEKDLFGTQVEQASKRLKKIKSDLHTNSFDVILKWDFGRICD